MKEENKKNIEEAYNKWIGKKNEAETEGSKDQEMLAKEEIKSEESSEPYQDITPVSVNIESLPFEAKEGDELDIHGIIKSIGEDGVTVELQKLWNKTEE